VNTVWSEVVSFGKAVLFSVLVGCSIICFSILYVETDERVSAITVLSNVGVICAWSAYFTLSTSNRQRLLRWAKYAITGFAAWFLLPPFLLAALKYLLEFWGVIEFLNAHWSVWPSGVSELFRVAVLMLLWSPVLLWLFGPLHRHIREAS